MDWLIVADGEAVEVSYLAQLAKHKKILVCDGAYDRLATHQLTIDVLLGDFDSIDPLLLATAEKDAAITVIKAPDQNATDLDKAICYLDQQAANSIHIVSAFGLRLDHSLHNLFLLKRHYQHDRPLIMETVLQRVYFFRDRTIKLNGDAGAVVSIFGFDFAEISSGGLQYDVQQYPLKSSSQDSACNALEKEQAIIDIKGEAVVMLDRQVKLYC